MRLLFDHQVFTWQKQGGISRYFSELIRHASADPANRVSVALLNSFNIHLSALGIGNRLINILLSNERVSRSRLKRYTDRLNEAYAIRKIRQQQFDVFIPTYYDPYFLPYIQEKPFVLTVYDMIHELYPENFGSNRSLANNKHRLIQASRKIIAISENTKKDILRFYPETDPGKISVVHLCHSIEPQVQLPAIDLPRKYILFVGERRGYKNFEFFIRSAVSRLQADPDLYVLCVGGSVFSDEEMKLFSDLRLAERLVQYTAADRELYAIYKQARVFVFPSAYEGFGIPVLEAMASGCPVLLSRSSSFPEVALDAALYFNPGDANEFAEKLDQLLADEALRERYIQKGFENTKRFSWEQTTAQCLAVFASAK